MPSNLSIQSYLDQIVAGQPRKPSPIKNAIQAIQDLFTAGLTDADIRAAAGILRSKLETLDYCKVYHSTTHSFTNTTTVVLAWDSESADTNTMHDTATNNSRVTIKKNGTYVILGQIGYSGNDAAGGRKAFIKKNGSDVDHVTAAAGQYGESVVQVVAVEQLVANDYIELQGQQNSGGTISDQAGAVVTFLEVAQIA
jgi:hypothetical protein